MKRDLDDHNENNICLAIQAVATVATNEMAESLSKSIYLLLVSR